MQNLQSDEDLNTSINGTLRAKRAKLPIAVGLLGVILQFDYYFQLNFLKGSRRYDLQGNL